MSVPPLRPILLILGPTAGGKTALAIELARRLPGGGECICADSMQVYRGMDIGTAKPTPDERAAVPHHLFDIAEPSDDGFTVDRWLELAERTIGEIRARDRWPIMVGGTNLYIQALLYGLISGPEPDPALRAKLDALPAEALRAWLERVDPDAAERIHPNDRRRTIRAIEVFERTGTRLSAQQTQWESGTPRGDIVIIGLDYPAEAINRRINARVRSMVEAGLVDEVRRLHDAGRLGRQAAEALGYKQIIEHLRGEMGLQDAVEQIKIRTRRFAKQQRTWLRRFRGLKPSIWLSVPDDAASEAPQILAEQAIGTISQIVDSVAISGDSSSQSSDKDETHP